MSRVVILILAAGGSSRMGETKQVLPFENTTILGKVAGEAKKTKHAGIYCVLGANSLLVETKVNLAGIQIIRNKLWKKGLGVSIATGVSEILTTNPAAEAILVLLGDQPKMEHRYLNEMMAEFENKKDRIVASQYNGFLGVPAIFPKLYFNLLTNLKGDEGAGKYINRNREKVHGVKAGNQLTDVDTPQDYQKILKQINQ